MENVLVELMSNLIKLTEEEVKAIETSFPIKSFKKGTHLLKEGQVAKDAYFVVKGCIRKYAILDGEEKTLDFYTENQSAANFNSLSNNTPSDQYLTCTEDSTVAIINSTAEQLLYKAHPRFETVCRTEMEKMMGSQQLELSRFMMSSPQERYLYVLNERPDLLNRVPQYQLASYLGIKPESLSRIRKRLSNNEPI